MTSYITDDVELEMSVLKLHYVYFPMFRDLGFSASCLNYIFCLEKQLTLHFFWFVKQLELKVEMDQNLEKSEEQQFLFHHKLKTLLAVWCWKF